MICYKKIHHRKYALLKKYYFNWCRWLLVLSHNLRCTISILLLCTFTCVYAGVSHIERWIAEIHLIYLLVFVKNKSPWKNLCCIKKFPKWKNTKTCGNISWHGVWHVIKWYWLLSKVIVVCKHTKFGLNSIKSPAKDLHIGL